MFGSEIMTYESAGKKMHGFESVNLDEFLYLLMGKHMASFYLSNCEMKFQ